MALVVGLLVVCASGTRGDDPARSCLRQESPAVCFERYTIGLDDLAASLGSGRPVRLPHVSDWMHDVPGSLGHRVGQGAAQTEAAYEAALLLQPPPFDNLVVGVPVRPGKGYRVGPVTFARLPPDSELRLLGVPLSRARGLQSETDPFMVAWLALGLMGPVLMAGLLHAPWPARRTSRTHDGSHRAAWLKGLGVLLLINALMWWCGFLATHNQEASVFATVLFLASTMLVFAADAWERWDRGWARDLKLWLAVLSPTPDELSAATRVTVTDYEVLRRTQQDDVDALLHWLGVPASSVPGWTSSSMRGVKELLDRGLTGRQALAVLQMRAALPQEGGASAPELDSLAAAADRALPPFDDPFNDSRTTTAGLAQQWRLRRALTTLARLQHKGLLDIDGTRVVLTGHGHEVLTLPPAFYARGIPAEEMRELSLADQRLRDQGLAGQVVLDCGRLLEAYLKKLIERALPRDLDTDPRGRDVAKALVTDAIEKVNGLTPYEASEDFATWRSETVRSLAGARLFTLALLVQKLLSRLSKARAKEAAKRLKDVDLLLRRAVIDSEIDSARKGRNKAAHAREGDGFDALDAWRADNVTPKVDVTDAWSMVTLTRLAIVHCEDAFS